jgi:hypothetical protein
LTCGRIPGRLVSHADEVITDVNTRRVMARARDDGITIAWDYPGRTLLEVRILRSSLGFAATADDGADAGQEVVYQDVTGSFRDAAPSKDPLSFYTVFARPQDGAWVRWGEYAAPSGAESAGGGPGR